MVRHVEIVRAKAMHVRHISRHMRNADRVEINAASGKSPLDALAYSLRMSDRAFTGLVDGVPVVMFGVGPINVLAGIGGVWLLGTDDVEKNFVAFLRGSVHWLRQLWSCYPVMKNFVHDENVVSIRWLKWLGATMSEPIDLKGHSFRLFELRQRDV